MRSPAVARALEDVKEDVRSKQRDPDPRDTSLIRKESLRVTIRGSILRLQHRFLIKELLLGSGPFCLLLRTAFRWNMFPRS